VDNCFLIYILFPGIGTAIIPRNFFLCTATLRFCTCLPQLYAQHDVRNRARGDVRRSAVRPVTAIHQDVPFTATVTEAVSREIGDLARWLGLDLTLPR